MHSACIPRGALDRGIHPTNTGCMATGRVGGWQRYVALGDSITEGLCDPIVGRGEPWLGWADRLAAILARHAELRGGTLEFANLAVRGRRVRDVVTVQVPHAIELRADLVSILVGGNDLMSAKADPDALAAEIESAVAKLRASPAVTCCSPRRSTRGSHSSSSRCADALRCSTRTCGASRASIRTITLDLWGMRELQHPSMWAEDRVHLSPAGHRLIATRAAHALHVPYFEIADVSIPASDRRRPPAARHDRVAAAARAAVGRAADPARLDRRRHRPQAAPPIPRRRPRLDFGHGVIR